MTMRYDGAIMAFCLLYLHPTSQAGDNENTDDRESKFRISQDVVGCRTGSKTYHTKLQSCKSPRRNATGHGTSTPKYILAGRREGVPEVIDQIFTASSPLHIHPRVLASRVHAHHPIHPPKAPSGSVVYRHYIPHLDENEKGSLDQHRRYLRRAHEDFHCQLLKNVAERFFPTLAFRLGWTRGEDESW